MLAIRILHAPEALALLGGLLPLSDLTPGECRSFCDERGLFALVAEQGGTLAGFAVAESSPQAVRFHGLEGDAVVCRRLLARLLRLAGERDVCGWCPVERPDLRRLLRRAGFARRCGDVCRQRALLFYHLSKTEA